MCQPPAFALDCAGPDRSMRDFEIILPAFLKCCVVSSILIHPMSILMAILLIVPVLPGPPRHH